MGIARYDDVQKSILHRVIIRAQSVGVDAHIDPKTEENLGRVDISVHNF